MLTSISLKSRLRIKFARVRIKSPDLKPGLRGFAALIAIVLVSAVAPAFGQAFSLTAMPLSPFAVFPGGKSASTLTVNSTSAIDVALSCTVTPVQSTGTPQCTPSPTSVITPAMPTLNVTTDGTTPAGLYTITVTGVGPSTTDQVIVNLSVLAVTADYTLTVTTPVTPSSVTAGSGATAGITVTSLNGYSGSVTLSCSAVTPAVSFGPTCSFSPIPVSVESNGTATGTLTISTIGTTTASNFHLSIFYALFLSLPGLTLVALGRGNRRLLALLAPYGLALGLLWLPACGTSNKNSTTTPTGVTPKNSYTLTITGTDTNALAPSNGTQTVSLTVD